VPHYYYHYIYIYINHHACSGIYYNHYYYCLSMVNVYF
jgi:hypothetical protein